MNINLPTRCRKHETLKTTGGRARTAKVRRSDPLAPWRVLQNMRWRAVDFAEHALECDRSSRRFALCRDIMRISVACLVSSLAFVTASGQTPPAKPRMTEPLEKSSMPPGHIYRLETGPRMISRFGLFTSFQVNVDAGGNNILGDAANEPSISVDQQIITG